MTLYARPDFEDAQERQVDEAEQLALPIEAEAAESAAEPEPASEDYDPETGPGIPF